MAKTKERTELNKENWASSFNLLGEVKVNDNTFQLDQQSNKSDWCYNRMNIGVYCGERNGTVYAQAMGGYGINRENVIYCHGKKDDGSDDFSDQVIVAWEDREDEEVINNVGRMCFYTAAIEEDTKGKLVYMNFLSQYDMIQYLSEHVEDGMVLSISGNLSYQEYNGNINAQKEITKVVLVREPNEDNYRATFMQTILVDKDSKQDVDKDKEVLYVDAYVLEYFKEYNGVSLANGDKKGGLVPLRKTFEYKLDSENPDRTKKAVAKLFKPKKGVTQITFRGEFVESGGATVKMKVEDLPEDIQDLINFGAITEEEALADCAVNGSRERRMVLLRPYIKNITNSDGTSASVLQMFEEKYTDEDLLLPCLEKKPETDEDGFMDIPEDSEEEIDWLDGI